MSKDDGDKADRPSPPRLLPYRTPADEPKKPMSEIVQITIVMSTHTALVFGAVKTALHWGLQATEIMAIALAILGLEVFCATVLHHRYGWRYAVPTLLLSVLLTCLLPCCAVAAICGGLYRN